MINENRLAEQIAADEGKKVQVNIAQIKEVLRITLDLLSRRSIFSVWMLLRKHKTRQ